MTLATFGAGCFWEVEEAFRRSPGVIRTEVGYTGGHLERPTYEDVCCDTTGHAEVVRVAFDPSLIGYEHLLEIFWQIHDPTTCNRQGPDVGTQYRSVIFYHDETQMQMALASRNRIDDENRLSGPVVTEIEPAATFWRAEEYHQGYLKRNGETQWGPRL